MLWIISGLIISLLISLLFIIYLLDVIQELHNYKNDNEVKMILKRIHNKEVSKNG